jgi:hypothetical protein
LQKDPKSPAIRLSLAHAYAGLGMKQEAIQIAADVSQNNQLSDDHFIGPGYLINVAEIYAMSGEQEKSIDLVDHLLTIPASLSVPITRVDPIWDRLRANPRFEQVLAKYH